LEIFSDWLPVFY